MVRDPCVEKKLKLSERQMGLVAETLNGRQPGFRLMQRGLVLSPEPEENLELARVLGRKARNAKPGDVRATVSLVAAIRMAVGTQAPGDPSREGGIQTTGR